MSLPRNDAAPLAETSRGQGVEVPARVAELTLPFGEDSASEARARRDAGTAAADANTDSWWKDCADRGIERLAARGCEFQAADLLDLGVPEPHHPNRWRGRLHAAACAGSDYVERLRARNAGTEPAA